MEEFGEQIHKTVGKLLDVATYRLQTTMDTQFKVTTDTIMSQPRQMQAPSPMRIPEHSPYHLPQSPYDARLHPQTGMMFNPQTNRYENPMSSSASSSLNRYQE